MDLLDSLLDQDFESTSYLIERARELNDEQLDRRIDSRKHSVRSTLAEIVMQVEKVSAMMTEERWSPLPDHPTLDEIKLKHDSAMQRFARVTRRVRDRKAWKKCWVSTDAFPPVEEVYGPSVAEVFIGNAHGRAWILYVYRTLGMTDI